MIRMLQKQFLKMTNSYLKETSEEIAKNVAIRFSKSSEMTQEDYQNLKRCIAAEVLLAFAGQISVDEVLAE